MGTPVLYHLDGADIILGWQRGGPVRFGLVDHGKNWVSYDFGGSHPDFHAASVFVSEGVVP